MKRNEQKRMFFLFCAIIALTCLDVVVCGEDEKQRVPLLLLLFGRVATVKFVLYGLLDMMCMLAGRSG